MDKIIYIIELRKLEEFFISKGIKRNWVDGSTPSNTARDFCEAFCFDYDADYETDNIVIYLENGFVSYSDLAYLEENGSEYDKYELFDLRYVKKNNAIWY